MCIRDRLGNLQGMLDVAGFYTEYKDMIEFQFGLFNNGNNKMINSISDAVEMLLGQGGFGIGAQFHNVSKALGISTSFKRILFALLKVLGAAISELFISIL